MEVIDINNVLREERTEQVKGPSIEEVRTQNTSLIKLFAVTIVTVTVGIFFYFFVLNGGNVSKESAQEYDTRIQSIFSSIRQDFPNVKSIVCAEKDATRKDCVSFIFTFAPNTETNEVGTAIDTVDKALGVTQADNVKIKLKIQEMIDAKYAYIKGRRAPLSVLIISTNLTRAGEEVGIKLQCTEKNKEVECLSTR